MSLSWGESCWPSDRSVKPVQALVLGQMPKGLARNSSPGEREPMTDTRSARGGGANLETVVANRSQQTASRKPNCLRRNGHVQGEGQKTYLEKQRQRKAYRPRELDVKHPDGAQTTRANPGDLSVLRLQGQPLATDLFEENRCLHSDKSSMAGRGYPGLEPS